jgi:hypothetical protein
LYVSIVDVRIPRDAKHFWPNRANTKRRCSCKNDGVGARGAIADELQKVAATWVTPPDVPRLLAYTDPDPHLLGSGF